jgi:AcrR family transcriptional regulator
MGRRVVTQAKKADRPARSDALQNRERILTVALVELARSADVPLSAIAQKAGVGQGTLYRHFPTREALVMEVYRYEMGQVVDFAKLLLEKYPPDQALERWMHRLAEYSMTKAGLANAIREVSSVKDCSGNAGYGSVIAAAQLLLDANEQAGTIRAGVTTDDFFLATAGIWRIDFSSDWEPRLAWLINFVMQGLRAGSPASSIAA